MVCSCPGPGPQENGNLLYERGLVVIFRLFLPWLTYSCCTYQCFMLLTLPSLLNPSQPVTQLCGSFLEGFQCLSVPLNLGCSKLSAVFLKAELRVGIYRIKKALLPLRHTLFVLFVYSQCSIRLKILFVTILHHIFINTSLFTDTLRPFLESLLSPHHPSIVSLYLSQEQELTIIM